MAGSPFDWKDSPLSPWQRRAGSAAAWACEAASQAALTGLACCFQERCQVRLRCPARWRGARRAGGYLHTAVQTLAPDPRPAPRPLLEALRRPPPTCQPGPLPPEPLLPLLWSGPVLPEREALPGACSALPAPQQGPNPREQVRGPRGSSSPLPIGSPPPRLTGEQDKSEQLVLDTCPHPVSWGPTGLPHRPAAESAGRQAAVGAGGLRRLTERCPSIRGGLKHSLKLSPSSVNPKPWALSKPSACAFKGLQVPGHLLWSPCLHGTPPTWSGPHFSPPHLLP